MELTYFLVDDCVLSLSSLFSIYHSLLNLSLANNSYKYFVYETHHINNFKQSLHTVNKIHRFHNLKTFHLACYHHLSSSIQMTQLQRLYVDKFVNHRLCGIYSYLTNLTKLKFKCICFFDLSHIIKLTKLKEVLFSDCTNCPYYTKLHISNLHYLSNLKSIHLDNFNRIHDFSCLLSFTNLRKLIADNTNIRNLSLLTNLEYLNCYGNNVEINHLYSLTKLIVKFCSRVNLLNNINIKNVFLSNCEQLQIINCVNLTRLCLTRVRNVIYDSNSVRSLICLKLYSAKNFLTSMLSDTSQWTNLRHLFIHNEYDQYHNIECFTNLTRLNVNFCVYNIHKFIHLKHLKLQQSYENFSMLTDLYHLHLINCNLNRIKYSFGNNLTCLKLEKILNIPCLMSLTNLKSLSLSLLSNINQPEIVQYNNLTCLFHLKKFKLCQVGNKDILSIVRYMTDLNMLHVKDYCESSVIHDLNLLIYLKKLTSFDSNLRCINIGRLTSLRYLKINYVESSDVLSLNELTNIHTMIIDNVGNIMIDVRNLCYLENLEISKACERLLPDHLNTFI